MHIHEYQAKTLFSRNNIKTPKGVLIANTKAASKACSELGGSKKILYPKWIISTSRAFCISNFY
jgi:succinyl-CoA synthetase beta subunit